MASSTWPTSLPQEPFANGDVTYTPRDNVLATAMETGRPKRRQRWSAVTEDVPITLVLLGSQLHDLEDFRKSLGAVLPFNWVNFSTLAVCEYCFTTPITKKFVGVDADTGEFTYEVSFSLELQP